MKPIRSPLSPMMMITALETIQSLLENYPCSLSGYERTCLTKFAISVAESMETSAAGLITILPYSVSPGVIMGLHAQKRLRVAHSVLKSLTPGDWARYCSEPWNNLRPPTSPDTSQRNTLSETTRKKENHHS